VDKSPGEFLVLENENRKHFHSPTYNFRFDKKNGNMLRWGRTPEEDPEWSPFGPEIADIEISVNGCPNACRFCYKGNTNDPPTNMSLETFKAVLDKFPRTLTQVALGLTGIQTNPDLFPIMEYCRAKGVVPNFTISGIDLTEEYAKKAVELAGAIAVSVYETNKNVCYDAVKMLTDLGGKQINIHLMYHEDNQKFIYEVMNDVTEDPRLANLNALVLLCLKPKGRGSNMHPIGQDAFNDIVAHAFRNGIVLGFDSCSTPKFVRYLTDHEEKDFRDVMMTFVEPCESSLFSIYVNVHGVAFPCSFTEGVDSISSVDILAVEGFSEVWDGLSAFRERLILNERRCPVYDLEF